MVNRIVTATAGTRIATSTAASSVAALSGIGQTRKVPGKVRKTIPISGAGIDVRRNRAPIVAHRSRAVDVPLDRVVIESVEIDLSAWVDSEEVWISHRHRNIGNRASGLAGIDKCSLDVRRQRRRCPIDCERRNRDARYW